MKTVFLEKAAVALALICLGTAAFFTGKIIYTQLQYKAGDDVYAKIAQSVVSESTGSGEPEEPGENPAPAVSEGGEETEEGSLLPAVDFAALSEINGEIAAWLYSPDTVINYPVAQGSDNEYYLTHLADGTANQNGCLFIDCNNAKDFSDQNTLIYGHHMASGSMFASLIQYSSQEYYGEHPVMYLLADGRQYRLELFSGYTTTKDSSAYLVRFADSSVYEEWLSEICAKSDFTSEVQPTADDRIVTLSTCAYSFEDARYVVHGRLVEIRDGGE